MFHIVAIPVVVPAGVWAAFVHSKLVWIKQDGEEEKM